MELRNRMSFRRSLPACLALVVALALVDGLPSGSFRLSGGTDNALAQAAETSERQGSAAPTTTAPVKAGDIVIAIEETCVRSSGTEGAMARRGVAFEVLEAKEDAFRVDTFEGPGSASGWVDRKSVIDARSALKLFSKQIENNPLDASAYLARAIVWMSERDDDPAGDDLDSALHLAPEDTEIHLCRGLVHARNAEFDRAIEQYEMALRLSPKETEALRCRASAFLFKNDYERTLADTTELLRLLPNDASARLLNLVAATKQAESAKRDQEIERLSDAIRRNPEQAHHCVARGAVFEKQKKNDNAFADYSEAIRLDPECAEAFRSRGALHFGKGERDEAIADLSTAIELDPHVAKAFYDRARAWNAKGQIDSAIVDYTDAIRLDGEHVEALSERGSAWERKQEDGLAIDDYTEAIRVTPVQFGAGVSIPGKRLITQGSPRCAFAYRRRGGLWAKQREYQKALEDYAAALRNDPSDHAAGAQMAWLLATCPDAQFRDGAKGVRKGTEACRRTRWRNAAEIDALAAAYAETGDFAQAAEFEIKACSRAGDAEKAIYQSRLELYRTEKPYREAPTLADSEIRTVR